MKKRKLPEIAENALDISRGILSDLPDITLYASSLCEIDNFKGLIDFSKGSVRVNTADSVVRIDGSNLSISYMTDESISIKGNIKCVSFE